MTIQTAPNPHPLVTVYITNHNYADYLQQSIDSVLGQTLDGFELIIIDDGSTDNSRAIIEKYQLHSKVRIIYQQNRGLNVSNNIAMRAALGKYIIRLDADDFLDPNALLILSQVLEKDDQIGLVFPDYYMVDRDGNVTGMERRHSFEKDVSVLDLPAHGACTMIRREYLLASGGYDESFSCQDGYDLWIKFIHQYRVTNINTPLFYYRQHGSNLTRNEERILSTRTEIKDKYVQANSARHQAVAFILVRGISVDPGCIALQELGGSRVLDWSIRAVLKAEKIDRVVVSSSDAQVEAYVQKHYPSEERLWFMQRPQELARLNVSGYETIQHLLSQPRLSALKPDAFVLLSIESPFMDPKFISDAVNTLFIFDLDSVVGVRPETSILYQHDGHGLHPILNMQRFTHLERETLYRYAGGLSAARIDHSRQVPILPEGKRGHVVIDQRSAHQVRTEFDMLIAQYLTSERQEG